MIPDCLFFLPLNLVGKSAKGLLANHSGKQWKPKQTQFIFHAQLKTALNKCDASKADRNCFNQEKEVYSASRYT